MPKRRSARVVALFTIAVLAVAASGCDYLSRVSVDHNGGDPGDATQNTVGISSDGRYVAFSSSADLLGDGTTGPNIYLRDMRTNVTTRVSVDNNGDAAANSAAYSPRVSADGRYVVF